MVFALISFASAQCQFGDVTQAGFDAETGIASGPDQVTCGASSPIFINTFCDHGLDMTQTGNWAEILVWPDDPDADLALWVEDAATGNMVHCDDDSLRALPDDTDPARQPYLRWNATNGVDYEIFVGSFGTQDFADYTIFGTEIDDSAWISLHNEGFGEEVLDHGKIAAGQAYYQNGTSNAPNPNNGALPPANPHSFSVHEVLVTQASSEWTLVDVEPNSKNVDLMLIVERPPVAPATTGEIEGFVDDTATSKLSPLRPVRFDQVGTWKIYVVGFDNKNANQAYQLTLTHEL